MHLNAFLECGASQVLVITGWIFSDTQTCPDVFGDLVDFYQQQYLSECARWLGYDEPYSIDDAKVEKCFQYPNNGTVRYRSSVCCPGKEHTVWSASHMYVCMFISLTRVVLQFCQHE